jgi:hypothetical protein
VKHEGLICHKIIYPENQNEKGVTVAAKEKQMQKNRMTYNACTAREKLPENVPQ